MPLPTPTHPSFSQVRAFSQSCSLLAKSTKQRLAHEHAHIPPYPYGASTIYKQSNFGLYGLQKIRFGNIVSKKNEIKTRRHWRPNVHFKRLWSESLERMIRLRITTKVLRTVDKVGGLDEYLLGGKARRVRELGMGGWKLRWRVMQTERVKERFRKERIALGLVPAEDVLTGLEGNLASEAEVQAAVEEFDEQLAKGMGVDMVEEGEGTFGEEEFMREEKAGENAERKTTL
ncbi:ribosomal L28 family-domain-containing protein [Halenospora varia]|nr:ribosomal L28 family-domain-containing protein [Halenospora varia]